MDNGKQEQPRQGPPTRYVKEPSGIKHLLGKQVLVSSYAFGLLHQYAGTLTEIMPPKTVGGKGAGIVLARTVRQQPGRKSHPCGLVALPWTQVYNVVALADLME